MTQQLVKMVQNRINVRNQNWLCAIVGETGSGKSYIAMELADAITDGKFQKDASRVYFSVKSLIKDIQDDVLKKGDVAILDESGVAFAARSWYSVENKNFGFLLQIIRHRNFAIIFCLPSLSFMDKMGRILIHTVIETKRIDRKRGRAYATWKKVTYNEHEQKTFFKYPRLRCKDGVIRRIEEIPFKKPIESLLEAYELKKQEFTKRQTDTALRKIEHNDFMSEEKEPATTAKTKEDDMEAYFNSGYSDFEITRETGYNKKIITKYRKKYNERQKKEKEEYESSLVS